MSRRKIAEALIDEQGELFSVQVGANIARDVPQQWFHWLLTVQLCSARISGAQALQAAKALKDEGLHKVKTLLESDRQRRIRVLNRNGYARYDNLGADQIRAAAELVDRSYGGDLRRLREAAGGDAGEIRRLLQEVKGIGPAGADIFCREAQLVWDELAPTADRLCLDMAAELGLPDEAGALSRLAGDRESFVHLLAALARAKLDGPSERVRAAAGQ
jgi:hypothetical protein